VLQTKYILPSNRNVERQELVNRIEKVSGEVRVHDIFFEISSVRLNSDRLIRVVFIYFLERERGCAHAWVPTTEQEQGGAEGERV